MSSPCPNCGAIRKEYIITADWKHLIEKEIENPHWECPVCQKIFCNNCFKPDYNGNGKTFFCPHCNTKLYFPRHYFRDLYKPYQLN